MRDYDSHTHIPDKDVSGVTWISGDRKGGRDKPEESMKEQQGAVRTADRRCRLEDGKEEAQRHTKTQGERQRDRDGTTRSTKELPSTQIHGMKGANSWGWRQRGARVLVIKQFNRDLFPKACFMKQLKKYFIEAVA